MARRQSTLQLAFSLAVCFAVAAVGARTTAPAIGTWYVRLRKPGWTPPPWIFGPVWSVLYTQMGFAAWLVWRRAAGGWLAPPLRWHWTQLALNAAWTAMFFGWKRPGTSALEIVVLWAAIAGTIRSFHRESRLAALLLVPYLGWVSFAAALNFAVWRLNRETQEANAVRLGPSL